MSHSSTSSSKPQPKSADEAAAVQHRALGPWVPKAAVGTLILVLALNALAGRLIARTDWLPSEPRALVTKEINELRRADDVWMLGSSTLAQGIEPDQFREQTKLDTAVFTLGSAGPISLTEMALAGLKDNPKPPRAIYLFLFKDMFNHNRPNVAKDLLYVRSLNAPTPTDIVSSYCNIYSYRHSLKHNSRLAVWRIIAPNRAKIDLPLDQVDVQPMDNSELAGLMSTGKDFEFTMGRMDDLAALCKEKSVKLRIVITPTAEAAIKWQATFVPDLPYEKLLDQIRERGEDMGFELIDFTGLFESTSYYYRDAYHIRPQHMIKFTAEFVNVVKADLTSEPDERNQATLRVLRSDPFDIIASEDRLFDF